LIFNQNINTELKLKSNLLSFSFQEKVIINVVLQVIKEIKLIILFRKYIYLKKKEKYN